MRVEVAERVDAVEIDRPRVVLVEDPGLAVVDSQVPYYVYGNMQDDGTMRGAAWALNNSAA